MGESWAVRIQAALRAAGSPLGDGELAFRLDASRHQTINAVCRRLEAEGVLTRRPGPSGKIVNGIADAGPVAVADPGDGPPVASHRSGLRVLLSEDEVKSAVRDHLQAQGWAVTIAWGRERGVDIEAHRGDEHLYLEAKGEAANPPQQVNYFLGALGELVQRLRDPTATYGLALPDNPQYRNLVRRLPPMAFERLSLTVLFVSPSDRSTITTVP